MSNQIIINNVEVDFKVQDGEVFTTSLQIAEVFEKQHFNILRTINNMPQNEFKSVNFKPVQVLAKVGAALRSNPYYNITRDGFSLLVMGFTGAKAYAWKIAFINAFNEMEKRLKQQPTYKKDELVSIIDKGLKYDELQEKYILLDTQKALFNLYTKDLINQANKIKVELEKWEDMKANLEAIALNGVQRCKIQGFKPKLNG